MMGVPQSMLYNARGQSTAPSDGNGTRNRSAEQQHSYNSGNPMNYLQFLNGQDPSLSRYVPATLSTSSPTNPQWNAYQGGYAYNLPTAFGGFGGFSQFSRLPEPPEQMPPSMGRPTISANPFYGKPRGFPEVAPSKPAVLGNSGNAMPINDVYRSLLRSSATDLPYRSGGGVAAPYVEGM